MTATLFAIAIAIGAALLLLLRRRHRADDKAIKMILKWREGR